MDINADADKQDVGEEGDHLNGDEGEEEEALNNRERRPKRLN